MTHSYVPILIPRIIKNLRKRLYDPQRQIQHRPRPRRARRGRKLGRGTADGQPLRVDGDVDRLSGIVRVPRLLEDEEAFGGLVEY